MVSKSIEGNSAAEIQAALNESMADGYQPTIAFLFISIKQDRTAIVGILKQHDIDIVGATSSGEFIDGHQTEGEIAILLTDLSREAYMILFEEIGSNTIEQLSDKLATASLEKFRNPSLILCSSSISSTGALLDGTMLVHGVEKAIGAHRTFYGGMAGDDMTFTGSSVFTREQETDHGVIALVLDNDKVALQGMAITGWKSTGISRKVTKSIGNLIYTIDDKPAIDMYLKYLGKVENTGDKNFDVLQELALSFPFIVQRGDGETLLKTPLKINHEEKALVMDMEMPEGSEFWFSMPPDFDIVEEIIAKATQVRDSSFSTADALLIFSCAGRHPVLGPLVSAENEGLAEVWQSPMAGFFTYGEFGREQNGRQHFHSGACCWVALKEK